MKEVFNQFCLGGEFHPPEGATGTDSEGLRIWAWKDAQYTYRAHVDGKTLKSITRLIAPGSWLNFQHWHRTIGKLYGSAEDLSTLPRWATSRASRLRAVRGGHGVAQLRWPQTGWQIQLLWADEHALQLIYAVNDQVFAQTVDEGL